MYRPRRRRERRTGLPSVRALGLHAFGCAWVWAVETALVQVVTAAVEELQSRGGEAVHVIRMSREAKS